MGWGRSSRLIAVLALLTAAACSGGGGSGNGDNGGAGPAAERAPGEVVVAVGEDIWPLTGVGPTSKHFTSGELSVGIFEPLLRLGPDFTAQPGLAERWEPVNDRTWRFHLRRGVQRHDGRPFSADDVVWSWNRELLPRSVTSTLASVVKVDDFTVDFNLTAANQRLPEQLVHPEGPIVARNTHCDATAPVGTGPFKLVEYRPRQFVTVERFDGYWGEKASASRITFRFMPERATRLEALRDGDVDMAAGLAPVDLAALAQDSRFRVVRAPIGATHTLNVNVDGKAPFDLGTDLSVRRALSLAVDRNAYVATVLEGSGEAGRWMAPGAVLGPHAGLVAPLPYDLHAARRALESGGWQRGADGAWTKGARRLSLTIIAGLAVPDTALPFVRDQLRALGIDVVAKQASDTVTLEEFRQRGYDADIGQPNQNDANPAFLPGLRSASITGLGSESLNSLASNALAASSRDAVQRLSAEMMQALEHDLAQVLPLAGVSRAYAMRQGVDLPNPHPSAINQSWVSLRAAG